MRKVMMAALLATVSGSAIGAWEFVRKDVDGMGENSSVYVDRSTIETVEPGAVVKIWTLRAYDSVQQDAPQPEFWSAKDQTAYNCKEKLLRTQQMSNHSGKMGDGRVVYESGTGLSSKWVPVKPGAIHEAIWKIACGK